MTKMDTGTLKKVTDLSPEDLARLGGGVLAYIREIESEEAAELIGPEATFEPTTRLFCLYDASGIPVSISGTREDAMGSAFEHELFPMSVH